MDLQRMAQSVLNAAVNRMLDKPEFRTAISARGARVSQRSTLSTGYAKMPAI